MYILPFLQVVKTKQNKTIEQNLYFPAFSTEKGNHVTQFLEIIG